MGNKNIASASAAVLDSQPADKSGSSVLITACSDLVGASPETGPVFWTALGCRISLVEDLQKVSAVKSGLSSLKDW